MSDYDYLNQWEDRFDKEAAHNKKMFDEPLANDPFTIVEDRIERPGATHTPLNPSPPDDFYDVPKSDHIPSPRPYGPMGYRSPDAPRPDVLEGEHHTLWREPRIPPLRSTPGKSTKPVPYVPYRSSGGLGPKLEVTECPKEKDNPNEAARLVTKQTCMKCEHYDFTAVLYERCALKKKEADRLSGKG
jgi:hypothetical protein